MATNEFTDVYARALQLQQEAAAREAQALADRRAAAAAERERTRSRTWGEVGQDIAVDTLQTVVGLGQGLYGLGNIATLGTLDRATGMSENFRRTQEITDQWHSDPLRRDQQQVSEAFDRGIGSGIVESLANPSTLFSALNESAAYMVPSVGVAGAAARAGRAAGAGEAAIAAAANRAALRTAGATSAGVTNVDAINSIQAAGGDESLQQWGGLGAGGIAGLGTMAAAKLTGGLKLDTALGRALAGDTSQLAGQGGVRGALQGALAYGGRESAEEALQSNVENTAVNLPTPGAGAFDNAAQATGMGALLGAAMGAPLGAGIGMRKSTSARDAVTELTQELGIQTSTDAASQYAVDPATLTPEERAAYEYGQNFDANPGVDPNALLGQRPMDANTRALLEYGMRQRGAGLPTDLLGDPLATPVDLAAGLDPQAARPREVSPDQMPLPFEAPPATAPVAEPAPAPAVDPVVAPVAEPTSAAPATVKARTAEAVGVNPRLLQGKTWKAAEQLITDNALLDGDPATFKPRLLDALRGAGLLDDAEAPRWIAEIDTAPEASPVVEPVAAPTMDLVAEMEQEARQRDSDAATDPVVAETARLTGQRPDMVRMLLETGALTRSTPEQMARELPAAMAQDEAAFVQRAREGAEATRRQVQEDMATGVYDDAAPLDVAEALEVLNGDAPDNQTVARQGTVASNDARNLALVASNGAAPASTDAPAPKTKAKKPALTVDDADFADPRSVEAVLKSLPTAGNARGKALTALMARAETHVDVETVADAAQNAGLTSKGIVSLATDRHAELALEALNAAPDLEAVVALHERHQTEGVYRFTGQYTRGLEEAVAQRIRELGGASVVIDPPPTSAPVSQTPQEKAVERLSTLELLTTKEQLYQALAGFELGNTRSYARKLVSRKDVDLEFMRTEVDGILQDVVQSTVDAEAEAPKFSRSGALPLATVDEELDVSVGAYARDLYRRSGTDSPFFKRWFGQSRMKNKDGKPVAFYHRSFDPRDSFDNRRLGGNTGTGTAALGHYFAMQDVGNVERYGPVVERFYLRMEKPKAISMREFEAMGDWSEAKVAQYKQGLQAKGFDGLFIQGLNWSVVFDGKNVKAVSNLGTFDESGSTRYDRTKTQRPPLDRALFDQGVAILREQGEIAVHETVADLQRALGHPVPGDVRGAFHRGEVHIVRANIPDKRTLWDVVIHERAHASLAELVGPNHARAALNRLWANAAVRGDIQRKAKALQLDRSTAAEEVLVDMAVAGKRVNGDVLTKLRSGLENGVLRFAGAGEFTTSGTEIDALIDYMGAYRRGVETPALRRLLEKTDPLGALAEGRLTDTPRLSRALDDMDRAIASAVDGEVVPMDSVVKSAFAASKNVLSNAVQSTKDGGAYKFGTHFLSLDQMRNLYDGLFTDGARRPLRDVVSQVRAKQNDQTKLVNQTRKVSYTTVDANGKQVTESYEVSPHDHTQRWTKLLNSKEQGRHMQAMATLTQNATLYRVFPDRGWAQQEPINYAEAGFSEADRKAAHARIAAAWAKLSPEARSIYKQTQALYASMWSDRFKAMQEMLVRTTGIEPTLPDGKANPAFKRAFQDKLDAALHRMRSGPYSPLSRFGDYVVTVRERGSNKVIWHSGHETVAERDAMLAELRRGEYGNKEQYAVIGSTTKEFDWNLDGVQKSTINKLEQDVAVIVDPKENPALHEELRKAILETYLSSLPQYSFMQHANSRKNVDGFTYDAFRAFGDYTLKAARNTAALRHNHQISSNLLSLQQFVNDAATNGTRDDQQVTKMQRVVNAVRAQHAASVKASSNAIVDRATEATFLWMMTSPSQLFINALQTPMVALPILAGRYGAGAAARALRNAMGTYLKHGKLRDGFDLLGDGSTLAATDRAVLERLRDTGALDFTLTNDVSGVARGENELAHGRWRTVTRVAGLFMNKSELFNRQVTALAAVELARGKNPNATLEELTDAAQGAIYDSHFDYSQSNKPIAMQNATGKLLLQFQQYRFNMLAMLGKQIRDSYKGNPEEAKVARTTLSWLLGMQLAFAGAAGTVLAPIVFGIADLFRDDDDLVDSRTAFVQSVPRWLAHGALSGLVDPSRFAADTLIPYWGDKKYEDPNASASDKLQYHVMQNIGPWHGLADDLLKGTAALLDGDVTKAMQEGLPKPMADAVKAITGADGIREARGVVYLDPSPWTTLNQFVGLRSGEKMAADDRRGVTYQAMARNKAMKQKYLGMIALGRATDEPELIEEGMAKIQAWNAANPSLAIKGQDIARAMKGAAKSQAMADAFGVPTFSPPPEDIRKLVGI